MLHKRYYVFAYDRYYPSGGMEDIYARTDTLEEARDQLLEALKFPSHDPL